MIRNPVVAGVFYPMEKGSLEKMLSNLFNNTKSGSFPLVISPHAGYEYSGKTTAYAIKSLRPSNTFIILGPNHNLLGSEFALSRQDWKTPLGNVNVNSELLDDLRNCEILQEDDTAHSHEHSIEVQLPFLQHHFRDFEIVPISIANADYSEKFLEKCEILGKHIAKIIKGKQISVVSSSDFSHYLSADTAKQKDDKALEMIKKLDPKGMFEVLEEINGSVCGYGPIAVMIYIAKELGLKNVEVINHTDSGDSTGDKNAVVSYYAIGFK